MSADGESMENEGFVWDSREPEAAALREAMGTFPTGVTVLTSGHGEQAEGMTANAVISVSLDPVLFLASVHRETRISPRIKETGAYAVSLLAANQEGLSRLFASPERSSGLSAVHSLGGGYGRTGAPLAAGALAAIECELEAAYPGGDHELFLGRVVAVHLGDTRRAPLVFHDGGYPPLYSSEPRAGQSGQDNAFVDSVRGFDARLSGRAGRKDRRRGNRDNRG
jgi:flavin reductase (DIM6/NTAB) family NADH-FMN oxidoreductase RutF